jgi:hypothetical protein
VMGEVCGGCVELGCAGVVCGEVGYAWVITHPT